MIKAAYYFIRDILEKRSVIYELAKRDFQQQYMGSYLGAVWVFLQPLLFITVLYLVFTLGIRAIVSEDMPFSIYLVNGIIAWLYFADNFNANTNVIRNYSFMVKKVSFRLSVLPIVKMLSSLIPHGFLLLVAILMSWHKGYAPSFYTLQVIYYLFAMTALLLALGWLTSSTSVFVRDVAKVVAVFIQFGFWLTPIFWNPSMLPERYRWLLELNPMYYIVTGYRDSIVSRVPFWDHPEATAYFWSFTFLLMIIGISVYRKLRPHFAEVI